jgi:hypothetical protein
MPLPTWSVGQVLTAADVNSYFVPQAAYKTGTTTRASTTTLANDPDLSIALAASSFYKVTAMLSYQAAATGVNFKWTFTLPAGSDSGIYGTTYIITTNTFSTEIRNWGDIPIGGTPSANIGYPVLIEGMVHTGGAAGNMTLQWAQNVSSASGTSLNAKSHLIAQQVG